MTVSPPVDSPDSPLEGSPHLDSSHLDSSQLDFSQLDTEGFLRDLADWNEEVAAQLAVTDDIILSPEHWEIIHLVRDYYTRFGIFPVNRVLIKLIRETYGDKKGTSIHLMTLFTGKPAKVLSRVSGLPKPRNCE